MDVDGPVFFEDGQTHNLKKTASISLEQGQNDRLMRRDQDTDKRTLLEGVKGICR